MYKVAEYGKSQSLTPKRNSTPAVCFLMKSREMLIL